MAQARDFIHFLIDFGGTPQKARVTVAALLSKERLKFGDASHDQLIRIFIKHRVQIEAVALSKMQRDDVSPDGVTVTTEDLSP
jgi:hypothetical protein